MVFNLSSYRMASLLRSKARDISGLMEKVAASAVTAPLYYDAKIEEVATLQSAHNALLDRVSTAESGRRNDLAEKMRLEERATVNKKWIDVLHAAIHDFKSAIGTIRRYLEIQKDMKPTHRIALESAQARMGKKRSCLKTKKRTKEELPFLSSLPRGWSKKRDSASIQFPLPMRRRIFYSRRD